MREAEGRAKHGRLHWMFVAGDNKEGDSRPGLMPWTFVDIVVGFVRCILQVAGGLSNASETLESAQAGTLKY